MEQVGIGTKIARGWLIATTSWKFIFSHTQLLFLSAFTVVSNFLLLLTVVRYLLNHPDVQAAKKLSHFLSPGIVLSLIVGFIILQSLLNNILHTAISAYAAQTFENKPASLFSALTRAVSRISTLLLWTLLSLTVGLVISSTQRKNNSFTSMATSILGTLLNIAWSILTFFVIPIIAIKNLGLIDTIQDSAKAIQKSWGESLGATFNIGAIRFIAFALLSSVTGLIVSSWTGINFLHLFLNKEMPTDPQQLESFFFGIIFIIGLPAVIINPIISAATVIFRTALYQYTLQRPTGPFSKDFLASTFVTDPSEKTRV